MGRWTTGINDSFQACAAVEETAKLNVRREKKKKKVVFHSHQAGVLRDYSLLMTGLNAVTRPGPYYSLV